MHFYFDRQHTMHHVRIVMSTHRTQTAKTFSLDSGLEITTYRNNKMDDILRVHHDDCGAYYGELVQASDPRQTKQRATVQQVNALLSYWHDFGDCTTA